MQAAEVQGKLQSVLDVVQQRVLPVITVGALALGASDAASAETTPIVNHGERLHQIDGPHLRTISQLPGFHLSVTRQEEKELDDATLKLTTRTDSPETPDPNPWIEWCTTLNVSLPGVNIPYDLTANHCFNIATGSASGVFFNSLEPTMTALNYIGDTYEQVDVVDPHVPTAERDHFPIAQVNGISVDTAGVDQSLLSLQPPNPADQTVPYDGERPYTDVPTVPLKKLITANEEPALGQQVALYGIPQYSDNTPVAAVGRYIGRYSLDTPDENGYTAIRQLDLVAVPAALPETDPCEHGSSGGSAVTATGQFFGSLSIRLSTGYGPKHTYVYPDSSTYDQQTIRQIEQTLDVKIPQGDTVCGFSVLPANIGYTLLAGFNNIFVLSKGETPKVVSNEPPSVSK